ncbi:MAG: DUF3106 domain-containing protein [Pedosphaera sp.]|nr:DUF3106 domain-containing protein [Pedosphaera sp.]
MRNELLLCVLLLTAIASEAAESATGNAERNPVAVFRGLLAMRTDARATELSTQPERLRAVLTTRLRDYDALPAVEREGRLRATELRYFLNPLLMTLPATRATQLATVPESFRSLVEERLAAWDKLPAEIQREILLDERLRQAMTRPAVVGAFPPLPPGLEPKVPENLTQWQALDVRQREQLLDNFTHYFRLDERAKTRVVAALPQPTRAEAALTLGQFEDLSAGERAACVSALKQLGQMTPAQQTQFYANAERWKQMPESERARWRKVVIEFPPLPPGAGPLPPLPPGLTTKQ